VVWARGGGGGGGGDVQKPVFSVVWKSECLVFEEHEQKGMDDNDDQPCTGGETERGGAWTSRRSGS